MARAIEREPGFVTKQTGRIDCSIRPLVFSYSLTCFAAPQSSVLFAAVLSTLEQIPQELVVDVVVILHFRGFHESPQKARTAIG
jgi:hypothetical protein